MSGLQVSTQITVGDLLTFLGLVGGLVSLVFLGFQVKEGANQASISAQEARLTATAQRGRFVLDVINRYFDDKEMLRLYTLIDSGGFVFNPDTPITDKDAEALSRTLYYFDTLGFLVSNDLIVVQDLAILRYRIAAFFESQQVETFLQQRYALGRRHGGSSAAAAHTHELAYRLYHQLQALPSSVHGVG